MADGLLSSEPGDRKATWDKNKKLYVGLGVAGIAVTFYLYNKGKSSGSTVASSSASPAVGTSSSSAYMAGAQAQAAQDQQLAQTLMGGSGGSGSWGSMSINPGGPMIPSGGVGGASTGAPGGASTGAPSSTTPTTTPSSTSAGPSYSAINDPFWGQQGVAVPQNLTPGTAIYMFNPSSGVYTYGGSYQPNAQNEYAIQGLPSAQARQAAGYTMGLYTQNG